MGALPVLWVQGRRVRRTLEQLPEAEGREGGDAGDALRVVLLGDSVAAGVGLAHHEGSLAGRLSRHLERSVRWRVVARSGLDAAGVCALIGDAAGLRDADVVVVSVGVNDVKGLHTTWRFRAGLDALLTRVAAAAPRAIVVLLGIPPFDAFPALPEPLRTLLGARGRRLDAVGRQLVMASHPRVQRLELDRADGSFVVGAAPELFCRDGFHPSERVHDELARHIARIVKSCEGPLSSASSRPS